MKKQISLSLIAIIAISTIQAVNAQSNEQPLRAVPKINEDQIIVCVTDIKNKDYYGQLSCEIKQDTELKHNEQIHKELYDVKDTFEMGLID